MVKVSVPITRTNDGFHEGHKALIEFAKSIGEVSVTMVENPMHRNTYLLTGKGTSKYPINTVKFANDCKQLGVTYRKAVYLRLSEDVRLKRYEKAKKIVDRPEIREQLLAERYIRQAICSLMWTFSFTNKGVDYIVQGPEVASFCFRAISRKTGKFLERKIFPRIVKDEHGLKTSSSWKNFPGDRSKLRPIVDDIRTSYQIGSNTELVKELNSSYPADRGWKFYDILVYERDTCRLEVTSFDYVVNGAGGIVEEIDYYE